MEKQLRKIVDKYKPAFSKGGKFGFLHSTFDAFETFLFVPNTVTRRGSHIRDANDLKRTMIIVIIALLPALLFGMYNVGYQHFAAIADPVSQAMWFKCWWYGFVRMLPMILVSYIVGLGIEFAVAQHKGEEVNEGFLVTGLLIPMIMPIDIPLWILALAVAFSVVFGKEVFGGTGMNVFNPALLARAFVFFAYTPKISGEQVGIRGFSKGGAYADGFSGATPLGYINDSVSAGASTLDFGGTTPCDWFWGFIPGSIGEVSTFCILIGAAILLYTGVASWRTMLSVFAGGLIMGWIFNLVGGNAYMEMPAYYHLLLGGFAFGAVFMATDPVTSSQTNAGKIITGLIIGMLTVLIRVVNPGYPEGMMLSILFVNALAPLVDYYVVQANVRNRKKRLKTVKQ